MLSIVNDSVALSEIICSATSPLALLPTAITYSAAYMLASNAIYLSRRSHLRKMSKRELLRIRTCREPGVSLRLYAVMVLAWQAFVAIWPVVEIVSRLFHRVSFYYTYPKVRTILILSKLFTGHTCTNGVY